MNTNETYKNIADAMENKLSGLKNMELISHFNISLFICSNEKYSSVSVSFTDKDYKETYLKFEDGNYSESQYSAFNELLDSMYDSFCKELDEKNDLVRKYRRSKASFGSVFRILAEKYRSHNSNQNKVTAE